MQQHRPWTKREDALVAAMYRTDRAGLCRALPHRTPSAIQQRSSHLGVNIRPFWTEFEDARLRHLWDERLSIPRIARELGRTVKGIYERAHRLGLQLGCPDGYEYLLPAMRRAGFTNLAAFRRLLRRAGVTIHVAMTVPKKRYPAYRRQFVDPFDVNEAVAAWVASEPVNAAARARGIAGPTLRDWLLDAGVLQHRVGPKTQRRVPTVVIDRIVSERRAAQRLRQQDRSVA